MIELAMVRRMTIKALAAAPLVLAGLWLLGGPRYAWSGAIGLVMTLANLWLAARIIGGVAENNPSLLLVAGLGAFGLGLALLTGMAVLLETRDAVFFPVTGFVLVGGHLILVLWEASGAYGRAGAGDTATKSRPPGAEVGAEDMELKIWS
jgi:hypothetical protein